MRKEAAKRLGGPSELPALAQSVTVGLKDVFSQLPPDVRFLRCFAGFFLPLPPIFESSTGLENALKDCSRTCFSVLALRQGNVYGKHWERIPQGAGAARGLLVAARAGAQLASTGSSCLVEMGKHMEVLNWRMGDKILSLCVFPVPLSAAHSCGSESHPTPGSTVRALVAFMCCSC